MVERLGGEVRTVKVLVACERSGVVRDALRALGHEAWSCDLVKSESTEGGYHLEGDVRWWLTAEMLKQWQWDAMIAFPDCTYLCNSGVLRLYKGGKKINGPDEDRWNKMREAASFFKEMLDTKIPRVGLENPVMHKYALEIIQQRHTQTIQPYQFGEDASKRTCLWLRNLPPLSPTKLVAPHYGCADCGLRQPLAGACQQCGKPTRPIWANQTPGGQNKLGPSPTRAIDRARTYQGIADAMATQWGGLV